MKLTFPNSYNCNDYRSYARKVMKELLQEEYYEIANKMGDLLDHMKKEPVMAIPENNVFKQGYDEAMKEIAEKEYMEYVSIPYINVPNNVFDNSLDSNSQWHNSSDFEQFFDNDESNEGFKKAYETQLPMTEIELLSGISVDGAREEELTDWLASVFIEYNVISIEMNWLTCMNLKKVLGGCFDSSNFLWGIPTILDDSITDHTIIFNYDGLNY